ncbi:MAG TPA: hypothetical protein VK673_19995 [Chthoniobacterales bacterium]|nr:hypothetical protein [Chthoniobacterales bacterium]
MDYWLVSTWVYVALALGSFIPVWRAARRKITKTDVESSASQAKETIAKARPIDGLDDTIREVMSLNFERLAGTLMFWKFEAAKYRAAHFYCLFWTIPSAVLIPILTQAVGGSPSGTTLVTVISAFTAILLAFHRGLKIEENYRGFRHGESEFYDLFRRMLDRPAALGKDPKAQIDSYLIETETIRRFVRNAETNNMATLDEARQLLKGTETKKDLEHGAGTETKKDLERGA